MPICGHKKKWDWGFWVYRSKEGAIGHWGEEEESSRCIAEGAEKEVLLLLFYSSLELHFISVLISSSPFSFKLGEALECSQEMLKGWSCFSDAPRCPCSFVPAAHTRPWGCPGVWGITTGWDELQGCPQMGLPAQTAALIRKLLSSPWSSFQRLGTFLHRDSGSFLDIFGGSVSHSPVLL